MKRTWTIISVARPLHRAEVRGGSSAEVSDNQCDVRLHLKKGPITDITATSLCNEPALKLLSNISRFPAFAEVG